VELKNEEIINFTQSKKKTIDKEVDKRLALNNYKQYLTNL
jgi:hypothetical protein